LSTRRDYFTVAAEWRGLGPGWALRGGFGVHAFKASGDLEFTIARRRPAGTTGLAAAFRVALLDAFNNVVFDLARGDPEQTPTHFNYRALPRAARLDLEWASRPLRIELSAGASTRSRVDVTFPNAGEDPFTQVEELRYAGLLVEVTASSHASAALYGTTALAVTERRYAAGSALDFDLREETSGLGGRARARLWRHVAVEIDGRLLWRPERRIRGDGSSLRHRDREVFAQLVVLRRPPVGWLGRLGLAYLDRRAGVLAPELDRTNTRDLMEVGYRFRSGFELAFGVRWDLDGAGVFDGGHLRLATSW
jgi:hypothetical protein